MTDMALGASDFWLGVLQYLLFHMERIYIREDVLGISTNVNSLHVKKNVLKYGYYKNRNKKGNILPINSETISRKIVDMFKYFRA